MNPEYQERVLRIGSKKVMINGVEKNFLTDEEIRNLNIKGNITAGGKRNY